jgi:hypothetical protein
MKTIVIMIALVLGTMTMQAQGWLGYTVEELKEEVSNTDTDFGYKLERVEDWKGLAQYELENSSLLWILTFNENNKVYLSTVSFKDNGIMGAFIQSYDKAYAPMGDLLWKSYLEHGVVTIELHPGSEKYWPWVGYKYESY